MSSWRFEEISGWQGESDGKCPQVGQEVRPHVQNKEVWSYGGVKAFGNAA